MKYLRNFFRKTAHAGFMVSLAAMPVFTAQQVVTGSVDSVAGSLRSSIDQAAAGDTVTFNLTAGNIITLRAEIAISKNIVIQGPNSATGINPEIRVAAPHTSLYRIFSITNGTVVLKNLIMQGGSTARGGVVYINGSATKVTMDNITATKGRAPLGSGVYNLYGSLVITNSILSNNSDTSYGGSMGGGGIYNASGSATIRNCSISNNFIAALGSTSYDSYSSGGGVYNSAGVMAITNCTINNNVSCAAGSDRYFGYSYGGGICNYQGNMTITNCTVSNNSSKASSVWYACSYGGGVFNSGKMTIISSTIANDTSRAIYGDNSGSAVAEGGGVYSDSSMSYPGSIYLLNTIIVKNGRGVGQNNPGISISDFSSKNNFGRAVNTFTGVGLPSIIKNCLTGVTPLQIFGTSTPVIADNGGLTKTIAIDSLSIAYRAGVRAGTYTKDTTISGNRRTLLKGAYYEGAGWLALENDATVSAVTPIIGVDTDQRGAVRYDPPCIGAYEVGSAPSGAIVGKSSFHSTDVIRFYGICGNHLTASFPVAGSYTIRLFNSRGQMLEEKTKMMSAGFQKIILSHCHSARGLCVVIAAGYNLNAASKVNIW